MIEPRVAAELQAWTDEVGIQALSIKRHSGTWHALAVFDGETVSAEAASFGGALLTLIAAVEDAR